MDVIDNINVYEPYSNCVDNTHLSVSLKLFEGMALFPSLLS